MFNENCGHITVLRKNLTEVTDTEHKTDMLFCAHLERNSLNIYQEKKKVFRITGTD
jgi:hypothetical protein